MTPYSGAGGFHTGDHTLRMASRIIALAALIFVFDIITPLGLAVWILYFIPLFLTLYWEWRHGPFVVTGIIIILLTASLFLSSQDVPFAFALLNRVFFCLMLAASALLIWNYKKSGEDLRQSEERYRILVEWSPDAIVVYREGLILYANPAFRRLFSAETEEDLAGKDLFGVIHADHQQVIRERISQAAMGARMQVPDVRMVRPDGREVRADLSLSEVSWDGKPAVLLVARVLSS